jgi:hypothetical protein
MTFGCSSPAPIDERADRDPPDHDHDGQDVEQLGEPVAGVGEGDHSFSGESR